MKKILAFLAKRFIAGEKRESAISAIKKLNQHGIMATVDVLGENVETKDDATKAADEYLRLLDTIHEEKVDANVSVKLTMMGLAIDWDFCLANVRRIVERAAMYGNFVRIDMEGSDVTQMTLELFLRLREEFENVGIVIQSYLYRSERDIERLVKLECNIRLCKGAYKEPVEVAFEKKAQVNENYLALAKRYLDSGQYLAIATHDPKMITPLQTYIKEKAIENNRYEWQMLFGIRRDLQKRLAGSGERVRVYVPYGNDWLGYFTRRMLERKENLLFAFRHLFIR